MVRSTKLKKSKSKNRIILTSFLVLLLAVGGGLAWHYTHQPKANTKSTKFYVPASPADNTLNNQRKGSSTPAQMLDNGATASSDTAGGSFTVQLGQPTQITYNGKPAIHMSNVVNGVTSGSCTLSASQNGGASITLKTSAVSLDVNYYDCGPLNIDDDSFSSNGNWTITLTVNSNGLEGSATTTADITND